MSNRNALLQTVIDNPEDDLSRLVFADWLEEHGEEERAEFIRIQIELAKLSDDDPRCPDLIRREQFVLAQHREWKDEVPKWARPNAVFRRGFVDEIKCSSIAKFLKISPTLWRSSPVGRVRIQNNCRIPNYERLSKLDATRWREIDFGHNRIGQAGSRVLAKNATLSCLTALERPDARIGPDGVEALSESPYLSPLRVLRLYQNDLNATCLAKLLNSKIRNLRSLDVSFNRLGDEGAWIIANSKNLKKLQTVDISGTSVRAEGIVGILESKSLPALNRLKVSVNQLGPEGAIALANSPGLARIRFLDLDLNDIGDEGAQALVSSHFASNLTTLIVSHNEIGLHGALAAAQSSMLKNVKKLDIGANEIEPKGIGALALSRELVNLSMLILNNTGCGTDGIRALTGNLWHSNLTHLNYSYNTLDDEGAKLIADCPNFSGLLELDLEKNAISDYGATCLASSPHLSALGNLELGQNSIGPAGAKALGASPFLKNLYRLFPWGIPRDDVVTSPFCRC